MASNASACRRNARASMIAPGDRRLAHATACPPSIKVSHSRLNEAARERSGGTRLPDPDPLGRRPASTSSRGDWKAGSSSSRAIPNTTRCRCSANTCAISRASSPASAKDYPAIPACYFDADDRRSARRFRAACARSPQGRAGRGAARSDTCAQGIRPAARPRPFSATGSIFSGEDARVQPRESVRK